MPAQRKSWCSPTPCPGPPREPGRSASRLRVAFNHIGRVRARLGVSVTLDLLFYVTGGLAYGDVTERTVAGIPCFIFSRLLSLLSKSRCVGTIMFRGYWHFECSHRLPAILPAESTKLPVAVNCLLR